MYRKQVRRRRAVLVALVIVSLILLSLSFSEAESGPIHSVQRGLASVFGPIEEGAGRALKPVRDADQLVRRDLRRPRRERPAPGGAHRAARRRDVDAEAVQAENDELRKALDFKTNGGITGYEQVTSRVIARSPTVWYSQVTIDQGSSSGDRARRPGRDRRRARRQGLGHDRGHGAGDADHRPPQRRLRPHPARRPARRRQARGRRPRRPPARLHPGGPRGLARASAWSPPARPRPTSSRCSRPGSRSAR